MKKSISISLKKKQTNNVSSQGPHDTTIHHHGVVNNLAPCKLFERIKKKKKYTLWNNLYFHEMKGDNDDQEIFGIYF